jgi:hypothetical protein
MGGSQIESSQKHKSMQPSEKQAKQASNTISHLPISPLQQPDYQMHSTAKNKTAGHKSQTSET